MIDNQTLNRYSAEAVELLERLIRIPSLSYQEKECADYLCNYLEHSGLTTSRVGDNITSLLKFDANAPTLMLCAHIDTVPAASSYSFDAVNPPSAEDRVWGLGSNDDGGSLVSIIATCLYFKEKGSCPVNIYLVLSCQEERSGAGGMRMLAPMLKENADFAIVGEPTCMRAAIAERGLLVLDGTAHGRSAHAARQEEGENAIYKALKDIEILRNWKFEKISPIMGEVKMSVTQINAGTAHNVIPAECTFVVDIRPTECYDNREILEMLQAKVSSELKPRRLTNKSSATPEGHLLLDTARAIGVELFSSPTTSDWMEITIPAIKMGPGDSNRSHKADEYILKSEIAEGIEGYIRFIENIKLS